jgi:hypothetical protein
MIIGRVRRDNVLNPSLLIVAVGYKPEIDLLDERRSPSLGSGQFMSRFSRGTAVGACNDNATESGRHRHKRAIPNSMALSENRLGRTSRQ